MKLPLKLKLNFMHLIYILTVAQRLEQLITRAFYLCFTVHINHKWILQYTSISYWISKYVNAHEECRIQWLIVIILTTVRMYLLTFGQAAQVHWQDSLLEVTKVICTPLSGPM